MAVLRVEPRAAAAWRGIAASWVDYDLTLAVAALSLAVMGLAMAYTNTVADGTAILGGGSTFSRGLVWTGLAILVYLAATVVDYRWLEHFAWPLYLANLGLLGLTLLVGGGSGGVSRWVQVGGIQFQFSELGKILVIIALARYAAHPDRLRSLWGISGACLLVIPPWLLVVFQPDLGTSLVFGAILVGMLFLGGASLRWLGVLAAAALAFLPLAWTSLLRDYQKQRILAFLDPAADPQGAAYQIHQAQAAVGAGGLTGRGLTNGLQGQLGLLPVQRTDFVFAVLAEELGFIGALVVFVLFVFLVWRLLLAAWRARDPFGSLVATGLASMLSFQFVVNVGMVLGLLPVTGIPLPFITHGGASLVSVALGLGVVQSVNIRRRRAEW
jgi:rod shape determining protein RodA